MDAPIFDDHLGFPKTIEGLTTQTFVPEFAFGEGFEK